MANSSIWPIDQTLSGATTSGQSGPGSDSNEGVFRIPQSSNITGASPSNCLTSYPGHLFGEFYLPAEVQSVYFTATADWATRHLFGEPYPSTEMQSVYFTVTAKWATGHLFGGVLPLCRDAVSIFYSHNRLGWNNSGAIENIVVNTTKHQLVN